MLRRLFLSSFIFCTVLFALNVPQLQGRVNDYAGMLSPEEKQSIEGLLARYEQLSTNQFAVLIIPSLDGDNLEDFSLRTVEKWRLGQKDKNNGLLLVLVAKERRVRIEVGYGLEPVITDAFSGTVIREVLAPAFQDGKYAQGLADTLYALMQKTGTDLGDYTPQYAVAQTPEIPDIVVLIFIVIIVLLAIKNPVFAGYLIGSMLSGGRGGSSGFGGFSGGGGSFGGGGASGRW